MIASKRVGEAFANASRQADGPQQSHYATKKPFGSSSLKLSGRAQHLEGAATGASLKQLVPGPENKPRAVLVATYAPRSDVDAFSWRTLSPEFNVWTPKEISVLNEVFNRYRKLNDETAVFTLIDTLYGVGITDLSGMITPSGERKLSAMRDTGLWPNVKLGITPITLTEGGETFKQPLFLVLEILGQQVAHDPESAYSVINPEQRKQLEAEIVQAIRQYGNANLYSDLVSQIPLPAVIKQLGDQ